MRQHIILCGLGKIGFRVLEQLRAAGEDVVAVDNRCAADDPRLAGASLVAGDCRQPDVLRRAGVEDARGVLILTSDDLVSLSTALLVRHLNPTVRVVVRLFNQSLVERLGPALGNMQALSTSALVAPLLAVIARTGSTGGLIRMGPGRRRQVAGLTLAQDSPLIGKRLAEVASEHDVALVAHQPAGQALRLLDAVEPADVLRTDDRIVVCGSPERVAELLESSDPDSLPELLWAGTVKRLARVITRCIAMIDWPLKVCAGIFFSVIGVSVLVFYFGMKDDDVVDAFYRTISLMATGADMNVNDAELRGSWQKAFIGSLRLVGTALTAAFTAIFTNYLIRANLGGALEVRRIPESGHIIVCGLGNVGFRVVEEVIKQGESVVVIEGNAANPFISTARRLGAAVIIGSATVPQVLKQANAGAARAVIAATSNDLVNVEISLMVRELAPKQRVVLRLIDAQLATTLRDSANVRLAVSIPELAAPAFVAALYGDRVRAICQVEGRMIAAYDLIVPEEESSRRGVAEMAAEQHVVPLGLSTAAGVEKSLASNGEMCAGDRLTVLAALDRLHQLQMGR